MVMTWLALELLPVGDISSVYGYETVNWRGRGNFEEVVLHNLIQ